MLNLIIMDILKKIYDEKLSSDDAIDLIDESANYIIRTRIMKEI